MRLSNTRIDRLGERLRDESAKEGDLALLTEFQEEFREPLIETMDWTQENGQASQGAALFGSSEPISVTGRFKQLRSIRDKLQRGLTSKTRLSQLQDIAGCRIVLSDIRAQDAMLARIPQDDQWSIKDLRDGPSFGYRAVHAVAKLGRYRIELQVRTALQQLWADVSEALDRQYRGLKYGEGDPALQRQLLLLSQRVAEVEASEMQVAIHNRDVVETARTHLRRALLRILESQQSTPRPA